MYPTRRSGIPLRPTQAMARCGGGVGARLPGPGDTVAGVRPEALLGLLAEEERLRVYAAVVLGADTPMDVAFRTGLPLKEATKALHRLEQGGLVATESGRLAAQLEVFKDTLREYAPPAEPDVPLDPDRQKAAVLRTFIRDGRLQQIPMPWAKRRIVLEHMAAAFEPGVRYPEAEVNATLRAWYDDYAALRRYLVDEGLMAREAGVYWRTGGPVPI